MLAPLLRLGLIVDEALNSYIDGWIGWHHTNLWSFYITVVAMWVHDVGRFMPLNLGSVYALFHFTHAAFMTKLVQLVVILANVATFGVFAWRLTGRLAFGVLAAACVPVTLQIRFPVDPIAGFAPLLPLTMELVLLALVLQLECYSRDKLGLMFVAAGTMILAWLTYEVTYAYIILVAYVAWRYAPSSAAALRDVVIFSLPLGALVVLDIVLRHAANVTTAGTYGLSLNVGGYVKTLAIQLVGAFPFSYAYFLPNHTFDSLGMVLVARPVAATIVGIAVGIVGFWMLRRLPDAEPASSVGRLQQCVIIGALIWFLAAPMIAASPRYQIELVPGQAYLPAYIEAFGVALVIASALGRAALLVHGTARRGVAVAIAAVLGVATFITYQTNRPSLRAYQPIWTQGRFALEEAVRSGLFDGVPEGSTVLLDHSYVWQFGPADPLPNSNSRYLLYMLTGKHYDVASIDKAAQVCGKASNGACDTRQRGVFAYYSDNEHLEPGERWTRVEHVAEIAPNADGPPIPKASEAVMMLRGAPAARFNDGTEPRRVGDTYVERVQACTTQAADTLPEGVPFSYDAGFYGEERNKNETFHWSQRRSSLVVLAGSRPVKIKATMSLSSFTPGNVIAVTVPGHATQRVAASFVGTPLAIEMQVPAGGHGIVSFSASGKPYDAPSDPRQLAFRLANLVAKLDCH